MIGFDLYTGALVAPVLYEEPLMGEVGPWVYLVVMFIALCFLFWPSD